MTIELSWNCDFCRKPGIIMSPAGILYCRYCGKSYGEKIDINCTTCDHFSNGCQAELHKDKIDPNKHVCDNWNIPSTEIK